MSAPSAEVMRRSIDDDIPPQDGDSPWFCLSCGNRKCADQLLVFCFHKPGPTCGCLAQPESSGIHLRQADQLAWCRPGQWHPNPFNSVKETWTVQGSAVAAIIASLQKCDSITEQMTNREGPGNMKYANFKAAKATDNFFQAYFFTKVKRWLDVVEIKFETDGDKVTMKCFSFSASAVPASVPCASIGGACLCPLVFSDNGQNGIHLRTLRALLLAEGLKVIRS